VSYRPASSELHRVEALLQAILGRFPDDVANNLRTNGATGRRRCGNACPLANYLTSRGVQNVHVDRHYVLFSDEDADYGVYVRDGVLSDFIRDFDAGAYPDLDAEATLWPGVVDVEVEP
jgi:hypothetical protein